MLREAFDIIYNKITTGKMESALDDFLALSRDHRAACYNYLISINHPEVAHRLACYVLATCTINH